MPSLARAFLIAGVVAVLIHPAVSHAGAPLTIDQILEIRHPSSPIWSPDGKHVAFLWDRCDVINLYLADPKGAASPTALTHFKIGKIENPFWSRDSSAIYFVQNSTLWSVDISGGQPAAVWAMPDGMRVLAPSPDGAQLAVAVSLATGGQDLVVRTLASSSDRTLTHNSGVIFSASWSPDLAHLAFVGDGKLIPHDTEPDYSGHKLIYRAMEYVPGQLYVIPAAGGQAKMLGEYGPDYEGARWAGASHLVFERESSDFKDRSIVVVDAETGTERVLHTDHEPDFWSLPEDYAGGGPTPSPDGKWIAWISDVADGWDHIYIAPTEGGNPIAITSGRGESWRPVWSHNGRSIAFDVNDAEHPGDRRVAVVSVGTDAAHATLRYLTSNEGTNTEPQWSPTDDFLVYQHTDWQNSADLYTVAANGDKTSARLTDSMPQSLDKTLLVKPKYVTFPGADGTPVPGWLFVPKDLDRSTKHPAIVWIHGDGINQDYDGWHIQRNYAVYYSFHQYLLQQGYVVFAPDYRGSIGYGSKWRSAVYMDVGGKDAEDASRAGDYLTTLPYVDANRIGVWGLSYGGFFTLIAVTRHPLLFRSAVDVAGVVDYAMYYEDPYHGDWTASRIGTPQQNPQVYANASPLSHIGNLQRPLLILHGTADVNVPFIESVRLVDEALKQNKGNLISFMMYPGEFHYFSREQILRDAWLRVDNFFAATLKGDRTQTKPQ